MSSTIYFKVDQSKILSSGNGLKMKHRPVASDTRNQSVFISVKLFLLLFIDKHTVSNFIFTRESFVWLTLEKITIGNNLRKVEKAGEQHFLLFPNVSTTNQLSKSQENIICKYHQFGQVKILAVLAKV